MSRYKGECNVRGTASGYDPHCTSRHCDKSISAAMVTRAIMHSSFRLISFVRFSSHAFSRDFDCVSCSLEIGVSGSLLQIMIGVLIGGAGTPAMEHWWIDRIEASRQVSK